MEELINKYQAWQILIQTAHNAQKRGALALEEAGNIFEAVKIGEKELAALQKQIQQEQEKSLEKEEAAKKPAEKEQPIKSIKGTK